MHYVGLNLCQMELWIILNLSSGPVGRGAHPAGRDRHGVGHRAVAQGLDSQVRERPLLQCQSPVDEQPAFLQVPKSATPRAGWQRRADAARCGGQRASRHLKLGFVRVCSPMRRAKDVKLQPAEPAVLSAEMRDDKTRTLTSLALVPRY